MNQILLSPGVVRMSPEVTKSLSFQHTYMHRDEEFKELYKNIDIKLKSIVCTNPNNYLSMIVTGSGTTSMDEVINTYVIGGKTLFIKNGLFGERWEEIGKFYNTNNVYSYDLNWGESINISRLLSIISNNQIKNVIMVHCDTSVGILNDINKIGNEIKKLNNNITFIVDAVSSFGVVDINMEKNKIDIIVTNPNKAIAAHMGLGIIIGSHICLKKLKTQGLSYSLDLKRHYEMSSNYETCNSVSISSMNALLTSLNNYKRNDYIEMYNYVYSTLDYKELTPFLPKDKGCPSIVTILCENVQQLIKFLKSKNIIIYPCKGQLENKGLQIAFYGYDGTITNVIYAINTIKEFYSNL